MEIFCQMQHEGVHPDEVTFTCLLKACGNPKIRRSTRSQMGSCPGLWHLHQSQIFVSGMVY
jgi:hypothetical protein